MSRRSRQLYFISILLAACISLPLILLYSSGYRINFKNFNIESTGSLNISSIPKDALITVLDESITDRTPAIINQILPGIYSVTVSAEGYHTWKDEATIEAQRTTIIDTIALFLVHPTIQEVITYQLPQSAASEKPISDFSPAIQYALSQLELSDDYKIVPHGSSLVAVLDHSTHYLYMLNTRSSPVQIKEIGQAVENYEWHPEAEQLVFFSKFEIAFYDNSSSSVRSLIRQSDPLGEVLWYPKANYIIYTSEKKVNVMETRFSDSPFTTTLYYGQQPHNIAINKRGTKLYLTETDGTKFELTVQ